MPNTFERGSTLPDCVDFIDCTKIKVTRPGRNGSLQHSSYSENKRMHCLMYQITTTDGLMSYLYRPEVGGHHDVTLLCQSGLEDNL